MTKTTLTLAFLLLLHNILPAQTIKNENANVLSVGVAPNKVLKAGDTITVRVKNLFSTNRGFTIEAKSLSKEPEYETAVYSAFFNADTSFFKKLKASQELSKSKTLPMYYPTMS